MRSQGTSVRDRLTGFQGALDRTKAVLGVWNRASAVWAGRLAMTPRARRIRKDTEDSMGVSLVSLGFLG